MEDISENEKSYSGEAEEVEEHEESEWGINYLEEKKLGINI